MTGDISHSFRQPDWATIRIEPARAAAGHLRSILTAYDGMLRDAETQFKAIKERIFNVRMCAFRIISERELWKLDIDPEYGVPYVSMYRWMQVLYPDDSELRYALEANTTQQALPQASVADLAEMKRCNAVTLASKFVSDSCRSDQEMIGAAKTASEREFRKALNERHGQNLEPTETMTFTWPAKDAEQVRAYLRWVIDKAGLAEDDYQGALLYLAIHELQEIEA